VGAPDPVSPCRAARLCNERCNLLGTAFQQQAPAATGEQRVAAEQFALRRHGRQDIGQGESGCGGHCQHLDGATEQGELMS